MEDYGWVEFIFLEMNLDENCYIRVCQVQKYEGVWKQGEDFVRGANWVGLELLSIIQACFYPCNYVCKGNFPLQTAAQILFFLILKILYFNLI